MLAPLRDPSVVPPHEDKVLVKVPKWQAASWQGQPGIEPKDLPKLENDARTTLIQGLGGLALLIGLYFTLKNLQLPQDGQITERYTRAVEQLGSDKLEVRIGAIYALERIARDSERDHWPIMEILTTYLRTHARWGEGSESQVTTPCEDDNSRPIEDILKDPSRRRRIGEQEGPRADMQAILTVLGRRIWTRETMDQRLNLSGLDLRGTQLTDAHLERSILVRTHIEGATFVDVHLEGANLRESHLEGAQLIRVHCAGTNFAASSFEGRPPCLDVAVLAGVYMHGANLFNTVASQKGGAGRIILAPPWPHGQPPRTS